MPCDSVQISESVPFEKVNMARLQQVMIADGWRVGLADGVLDATRFTAGGTQRFVLRSGETQATIATNAAFTSTEEVASDIKRAYATATVKELSAKFGWKLTSEKKQAQTTKLQFRR